MGPTLIRKIKNTNKKLRWHLVGKSRYHKLNILKRPILTEENRQFFSDLKSFYETGIAVLDGVITPEENAQFFNYCQVIFREAIQKFESLPMEDKSYQFFDKNGQLWLMNKVEGIVHWLLADVDHEVHATRAKDFYKGDNPHNVKPYTLTDFYRDCPFIKKLLYSDRQVALASYGNYGDSYAYAIKIERKTHTYDDQVENGNKDYKYNYIHTDTIEQSVFKHYLYMNDVTEDNGAFAVSPTSHHWKAYPKLLNFLMTGHKLFKPTDIPRLGIPPLKKVTGKAGTFMGFTPNAVHSATNVKEGQERWVVQTYYYTDKKWATDKESI